MVKQRKQSEGASESGTKKRKSYDAAFKLRVVEAALQRPASNRIKPTCALYPGIQPCQVRGAPKRVSHIHICIGQRRRGGSRAHPAPSQQPRHTAPLRCSPLSPHARPTTPLAAPVPRRLPPPPSSPSSPP